MKCGFVQPAPEGSVFAPDAFDGQIGQEIPVNMPGAGDNATARVVAAKVAEDGRSVELTLEGDFRLPTYGAGSFGLA